MNVAKAVIQFYYNISNLIAAELVYNYSHLKPVILTIFCTIPSAALYVIQHNCFRRKQVMVG